MLVDKVHETSSQTGERSTTQYLGMYCGTSEVPVDRLTGRYLQVHGCLSGDWRSGPMNRFSTWDYLNVASGISIIPKMEMERVTERETIAVYSALYS